jgi:hypothetical protein
MLDEEVRDHGAPAPMPSQKADWTGLRRDCSEFDTCRRGNRGQVLQHGVGQAHRASPAAPRWAGDADGDPGRR